MNIEHGNSLTQHILILIFNLCSLSLNLLPLENIDFVKDRRCEKVGRIKQGTRERGVLQWSVPLPKRKKGIETMPQGGVFLPLSLSCFSALSLSFSSPFINV